MVNEELVIAEMPRARLRGLAFHSRTGIEQSECVSIAYAALVDAAQRFDPSRGVIFWTFAERRVTGALRDFARTHLGRRRHEWPRFVPLKDEHSRRFPFGAIDARVTVASVLPFLAKRQREVVMASLAGTKASGNRRAIEVALYTAKKRMREVLS